MRCVRIYEQIQFAIDTDLFFSLLLSLFFPSFFDRRRDRLPRRILVSSRSPRRGRNVTHEDHCSSMRNPTSNSFLFFLFKSTLHVSRALNILLLRLMVYAFEWEVSNVSWRAPPWVLRNIPFRTRGTLSCLSLGGGTRAWNNHRLNYACARYALKSPSLYPLLPRLLLACIRPLGTRTVNTRFRTRNIWNNILGHNVAVTREGRDRGVTISSLK